jgi:hypothetical protein
VLLQAGLMRGRARCAQVAAFAPSGFAALMLRMVPKLRDSLTEQLLKKEPSPTPSSTCGA